MVLSAVEKSKVRKLLGMEACTASGTPRSMCLEGLLHVYLIAYSHGMHDMRIRRQQLIPVISIVGPSIQGGNSAFYIRD